MSGKKYINVAIEPELHTQLKIASVRKSVTLSAYVVEAIKEKLEREKQDEQ